MSDLSLVEICSRCGHMHVGDFKFCPKCGQRNYKTVKKEKAKDEEYQKNIKYLSFYSVFSIILLLVARFTEETFEFLLIWTLGLAIINLIFAFLQPGVWSLLNLRILKIVPLLSITGIAIGTGVIVSFLMDNLNLLLFEQTTGYMHYFKDFNNPMLIGLIIVALFPALFEELAFRGFVYNNLYKLGGTKSAIWGSSFLFGLVHFSLLSLVWIIPFGFLLAYYRNKYSTLIYGIVGHLIHNATVLIIEYYNVF